MAGSREIGFSHGRGSLELGQVLFAVLTFIPGARGKLFVLLQVGRSVVVDDLPSVFDVAKHEGEIPAEGVILAGKVPASQNECSVGIERCHLEIGKRQSAHGGPVGVAQVIAFPGSVPAMGGAAARAEGQIVGVPVGLHEGVDVAVVPVSGLLVE